MFHYSAIAIGSVVANIRLVNRLLFVLRQRRRDWRNSILVRYRRFIAGSMVLFKPLSPFSCSLFYLPLFRCRRSVLIDCSPLLLLWLLLLLLWRCFRYKSFGRLEWCCCGLVYRQPNRCLVVVHSRCAVCAFRLRCVRNGL